MATCVQISFVLAMLWFLMHFSNLIVQFPDHFLHKSLTSCTRESMTANQFTAMSIAHQLRWVHFEGEFVTSIRYYKYKVNLYQINNFLVEVFYNHKEACIDQVALLDFKSNRLNFYADQVKLPREMRAGY